MSLPLPHNTYFYHPHNPNPATPKHFSCHSPNAKTLFSTFPLCQNTSWSHLITTWQHLVTPGNIWSHLATPGHQKQPTKGHKLRPLFDIPATPKHYTWSHLATPGHTWQHLVTTWQHLVTTWQHLVTPGNTWSPVTGDTRTQTGVSIVKPPVKFEFPALFSAKPWPTGPVPEINVNWHGTDHP